MTVPDGAIDTPPEAPFAVSSTAQRKTETTYHSILNSHLDKAYNNMEQYLVNTSSLSVQSQLDLPASDIPISPGWPLEEILRQDFECLHDLLEEMTQQTKIASVTILTFGTLYDFSSCTSPFVTSWNIVLILADLPIRKSFLVLCALFWFCTPLYGYSKDHNMLDGVLPFIVYTIGIFTWGFPLMAIQQVGFEMLILFLIRLCRNTLRSLDKKLHDETLTLEDCKRLKAAWWRIIGVSVHLIPSRQHSPTEEPVSAL